MLLATHSLFIIAMVNGCVLYTLPRANDIFTEWKYYDFVPSVSMAIGAKSLVFAVRTLFPPQVLKLFYESLSCNYSRSPLQQPSTVPRCHRRSPSTRLQSPAATVARPSTARHPPVVIFSPSSLQPFGLIQAAAAMLASLLLC